MPQDGTQAIRGAEPNEDASCLGVPKPHISDGVYLGVAQAPRRLWGVPHAPRTETQAIRGAEPNEEASCLGGPKPHISDGVYLGVAQAPRVFMGSTPCPQIETLPLFGEPNPIFFFLFSLSTLSLFILILHDTKL